ncbi:MAG: T9SS type A sorting domain-containing protein, partial [bacterium]
NVFDGNTVAISASKTEHSVLLNNEFDYNRNAGLSLDGQSDMDTLTGNTFRMPTVFHVANSSTNDIDALNNTWMPGDTALISEKIFDKHDNPAKGEVFWWPVNPSPPVTWQTDPPCDMAEPQSTWYGYPEVGYPAPVKFADSLYFDTEDKMVGAASVKFVTSRGWYVALNYRPSGDSLASWTLSETDSLYFWVKTKKFIPYGFQYFQIRIGDRQGNYFRYAASPNLLNNAHEVWKRYAFPLTGNATFQRAMVGQMSWDDVNYVEFWADTWDFGYTLWLDGVQFFNCEPVTGQEMPPAKEPVIVRNYPNPFSGSTTIGFELARREYVVLSVSDIRGNPVVTLLDNVLDQGQYNIDFPGEGLPPGIYFALLRTNEKSKVIKMVKIN